MTNLEGKIDLLVAQLYSLRNWIEYGFKQVKNELGWADDRLTDYASIQRWWERVFRAYFLVSLQAQNFQTLADEPLCVQSTQLTAPSRLIAKFQQHRWWEHGTTWKSVLNNIRLIIQPFLFYCLISRWLEVFNLPGFRRSFGELLQILDTFPACSTPFWATYSVAA